MATEDPERTRLRRQGPGGPRAQPRSRASRKPGKAASAYLKPREEGKASFDFSDSLADVVKTLTKVGEYWLADPERTLEAERRLWSGYIDLWSSSLKRMMGEPAQPAAEPDPRDKRFADPDWSRNQFFDFIKQFYLITSRWAVEMVEDAEGLDPHTRQKAGFYVRQIANALAPSNFVLTNPELLRETLSLQRREPRARHAHARRGHQGRRRRPQDPPDQHRRLQARREPRHHPRQGDPPERALPAHPVRRRRPRRC